MELSKRYGIYLYKKEHQELNVLKDMLQLLKTHNIQKNISFAYVEAQTSLISNLSLWENLQIVTGGNSWRDTLKQLHADWMPLINLIKNPEMKAEDAQPWERFIISLLKGLASSCKTLLIDFNEDLIPFLMIQNLKKTFVKITEHKNIYLASASHSLWLDCAHSIITRQQFKFHVEVLDPEGIKRHWVA
jgi:hypothetical protein